MYAARNAVQRANQNCQAEDDARRSRRAGCDCHGYRNGVARNVPGRGWHPNHLISVAPKAEKEELWGHVHKKMSRFPYNGYLEIWLRRVTKPKAVGLEFVSKEPICQIVNGKPEPLWNNDWIQAKDVLKALDVTKIVVADAADTRRRSSLKR